MQNNVEMNNRMKKISVDFSNFPLTRKLHTFNLLPHDFFTFFNFDVPIDSTKGVIVNRFLLKFK